MSRTYRNREIKQWKNLPGMVEVEVKCHNCPRTIKVHIKEGQKPERHICQECRRSETGDAWMDRERLDKDITAMLHRFLPGGTPSPCRTYRPGDRGFKTRAKQCTPILDIAS